MFATAHGASWRVRRRHRFAITAAAVCCCGVMHRASAQVPTEPPIPFPVPHQTPPPAPRDTTTHHDTTAQRLAPIGVTVKHPPNTRADTTRTSALQRFVLPATADVTAPKIEETVNQVDAEDAVKYLPSLFLRKRNYGDVQATVESRVWGVSSSARSLVYADDVPLSALVANNNTIGAPRWGLVLPDEITRIDVMYGPFSAAYPGNAMGAVVDITTRMPTHFEGSLHETLASQHFDLYGTDGNFGTEETQGDIGDRVGKFSFWLGGDYQHSRSQPLTYATSGSFPANTSGGYPAQSRSGGIANILGATGLLHTDMVNAKLKVAYALSPLAQVTYTLGYWNNHGSSFDQSYLTNSSDQPTFGGASGFASGYGTVLEEHTFNSIALRTDTHRNWDIEVIGTAYSFGTDRQHLPSSASANDTTFGTAGKEVVLDGTGWETLDLKAAWHPGGDSAVNVLSFGVHGDRYTLDNPTYNLANWTGGPVTSVATEGDGKTRTEALWAQDAWHFAPAWRLTLGGRYENWRAYDGYNANGTTTVVQPELSYARFSPKAILAWEAAPAWTLTLSAAKAYRFATVAELYQLVSTGSTFTSPDPTLKPDNDLSAEFRVARRITGGTAQVALFQDDVHDAITSQYLPLGSDSSTLYSYISNVDQVRARGAEVSVTSANVVRRLDLSGSATYVDARTLALSGRASATAPAGSAVGKFLPNIPEWRASLMATYHPAERVALTAATRYASKIYNTLDNSDANFDVFTAFGAYWVTDVRGDYRWRDNWNLSIGVDNLFNDKYFYYHPFPQRTVVGGAKYVF